MGEFIKLRINIPRVPHEPFCLSDCQACTQKALGSTGEGVGWIQGIRMLAHVKFYIRI